MTLLSEALLLCPLNELGIEPKQKKPQGWKNVFTPLAGLTVWVYGAVLAFDQWGKLLESGQLGLIAQKEKSLPLQKIWGLSCFAPPVHHPTKKCEVKVWGIFFFLPLGDFIMLFLSEGEVGRGQSWWRRWGVEKPQMSTSDEGSWHGSWTTQKLFL